MLSLHRREGSRVVARRGGRKNKHFNAKPRSCLAHGIARSAEGWNQRRNAAAIRDRFKQDGKPLSLKLVARDHNASNIASRPGVTCREAKYNWVVTECD